MNTGQLLSSSLAVIMIVSGVCEPCEANEFRGVLRNNSGVKSFAEEKNNRAFDDFTGALSDLPYSGAVHLNIGNTFLKNGDFEKALSEYRQAITMAQGASRAESETRFRALFNAAVALTQQKKVDEALAAYQAALEIKPDSVETKINMELLSRMQSAGGGEGENQQEQQDPKDQNKQKNQKPETGDQKSQKQQPERFENPRPTPRPFKSGQLSPQDARQILDEMKRQEEQIRAKMQKERVRERPPDKDW